MCRSSSSRRITETKSRTAKGYSLGAVDFMVSPIVPEILRTKVKVFVDLYLLAQQAKHQARERGQLAAERAARAAAEKANRRSAFLARASAALSGSLNIDATTRELARLTVPFLADVAAAHGARRRWRRGQDRSGVGRRGCPGAPHRIETFDAVDCAWWREAIERVMASGAGESFLPAGAFIPGQDIGRAEPPGRLEVPSGAKIDSLVILPMVARGRTVGVLSLGLGPSRANLRFGSHVDRLPTSRPGPRSPWTTRCCTRRCATRTGGRTSFSPCSRTSSAIRLRRSRMPFMSSIPEIRRRTAWAREVLERQVKQLRRLVDDLLDMSRITHGKIELQIRAGRRRRSHRRRRRNDEALDRRPRPCAHRSTARRCRCGSAAILRGLPRYWPICSTTPRSTPTMAGRSRCSRSAKAIEVAIRVRDSGIGIPKEALATIFEPFRQLGAASDRAQGGLGVGLTLVKRLVEKHGGSVEVQSEGRTRAASSSFGCRCLPKPRRRSERKLARPMRGRARLRAGGGASWWPTTTSISRRAWDFCSS